jgi:hypothetical protein
LARKFLRSAQFPSSEKRQAGPVGRHTRLLKTAGQAMVGDSQLVMQELVKHGEG